MKLQNTGADLRISGYASLFGQTDLAGDAVMRGAFAAGLLSREGEPIPMLLGHETGEPIGIWDRVYEDARGLFVSGVILGGAEKSDRTARMVRRGALSGLSIGYRTVRARKTTSGRSLLEIDLWEVSVVAFPMLRSARITQIGDPELLSTPTAIQPGDYREATHP